VSWTFIIQVAIGWLLGAVLWKIGERTVRHYRKQHRQ
jgi:NhaP-type Na+/H+ or K+/H+ antiporter